MERFLNMKNPFKNLFLQKIPAFAGMTLIFFFAFQGCGPAIEKQEKEGIGVEEVKFQKITVEEKEPSDSELPTPLSNGLSKAFKAVAHFSDGHVEDFSDKVEWAISNESIATMNDQGVVTAISSSGSFTVQVTYNTIAYLSQEYLLTDPAIIDLRMDPNQDIDLNRGHFVDVKVFKILRAP